MKLIKNAWLACFLTVIYPPLMIIGLPVLLPLFIILSIILLVCKDE